MAQLTASEQLLYSTVHLETNGPHGSFDGTGFFYVVHLTAGDVHVLVTNKHVIEDCTTLKLRCHLANAAGKPSGTHYDVHVTLAAGGVVRHPDPDVDLCAISMPIANIAKSQGKSVFYVPLDSSLLPTTKEWENLDAYEEVLMVGCPNGLFDEANNLPILRRGITSSHPAMNYNGKNDFLIDAACFPGSSGSPVLLFDTVGHLDKTSGNYQLGAKRVKLLGVLYGGPTVDQSGEVVLAKTVPISVSAMMHLGVVLKSSHLFDLENEVAARMMQQVKPIGS